MERWNTWPSVFYCYELVDSLHLRVEFIFALDFRSLPVEKMVYNGILKERAGESEGERKTNDRICERFPWSFRNFSQNVTHFSVESKNWMLISVKNLSRKCFSLKYLPIYEWIYFSFEKWRESRNDEDGYFSSPWKKSFDIRRHEASNKKKTLPTSLRLKRKNFLREKRNRKLKHA